MPRITNSTAGKPLACEVFVDGYMLDVLKDQQEFKDNNFDVVGLFTGEEGSGKTTLALQCAYAMDHTFNNDHIVFNADQFEKAISTLPKGSCIVWDEADDVGSGWASEMMTALKKTFKRIRKRNYIIFLVTPTFHDLNKYFAIHRTRFLIDVYTDFVKRGMFKLFNRDAKRRLYIYGKKEMNMSASKATFWARFNDIPKDFPVDMDAYELKKDEATDAAMNKDVKSKKDIKEKIAINLYHYMDYKGVPHSKEELAGLLDISLRTFNRYLENAKG